MGRGEAMSRYHAPLDPACPVVREYGDALCEDRITTELVAPVDEILEDFERRHRPTCKRCQAYGVANIEVVYE
jgi:hypothetical protein